MTEDEIVGWHHWLDGYEFEQAPGICDGQGSLACCSPWVCKQSDMTELLNWTETTAIKISHPSVVFQTLTIGFPYKSKQTKQTNMDSYVALQRENVGNKMQRPFKIKYLTKELAIKFWANKLNVYKKLILL